VKPRAPRRRLTVFFKASALTVDESTGDEPARSLKTTDGKIRLEPFTVSVVSW
jgi:hypothetical protein